MSKLIICRGLPASGKSTWAHEQVTKDYSDVIRCNRDDIRVMLHKSVWLGKKTEDNVVRMRDAMIRAGLKAGKTVISDDTNLDPKVVKHLAKIAEFFGADVEVRDFDVPLDICLERNSKREPLEYVPDDAIIRMYKSFFKNGKFPENPLGGNVQGIKFAPYVADDTKPTAVIIDIDGTLASHDGVRSPYDYTKVSLDKPRWSMIRLANMHYEAGDTLLICSGREDWCRPDTINWLNQYLPDYFLFMRETGDKRQDRIIKGEIFDREIRNFFNVRAVYDDRDQVVKLWRDELGLDCFQVNYGDF